MVEYLTTSLRDATEAIDSRTTIVRNAWVTRLVQFGTLLIMIFSTFNVVEFYGPRWSWALGCAWLSVVLSVGCLSLTFTRWFNRNWRPVVFLFVSALTASDAVLAAFGHQESKLFVFSLVLMMVGTGSILPWSTRYQISFNLMCLTSYVVHVFRVPAFDGNEVYEIVGVLTAAALSWFSCAARDRFVRRHEESERALRESQGALRQIFDANTDGITLIDLATRQIQDVNAHFLRTSGFTREEVVGKTTDELDVWTDPSTEKEFVRRIQNDGSITNMEVDFRGGDGRIVPSLLSSVIVVIHGRPCVMTLARDISDLRRSQEKLRESEARMRKVFDASLDWMSIVDISSGEYLDVNAAFAKATGYARDEIVGSNFWKLGIWPDEKESRDFVEKLVLAGEVRNQRATFKMRDGTLAPCLLSAVQSELWGKLCCISTARDITDLNETQEKLRRSEETFRKIFDTNLDAMSIIDAGTGEYIDVNPEFLRATGFNREETIGKTTNALALWVDPDQGKHFWRVLQEKGEVRNLPADFRAKDGSIVTCVTSGVLAEIDARSCCLGVTRDISELLEAEQKLHKSEATLRAIFDNSPDSISLIDVTTQTLVEVNAEMGRVMGFSREEMIGIRFDCLVPPADPVRLNQLMEVLLQGREVRNFEITCANRYGRTFPTLLSAATVLIDGSPYMLCVVHDITDLVAAREAALAASNAKSEFLSTMSHEIRTPMNAILGMADLMGENKLNSEQRRYLDTISSNGNALLELINSILDLAKVESGRLSLESVEFDLFDVTERAADTLAVRAHEKGLEVVVRFAPDLPPIQVGDPYRLRQILINLIGNAIKFTKRGEVVVAVGPNRDADAPGNLLFEVRDTGIGIAPEEIEKVFSIFVQADTSTTRNFGGSGLGLAIVERLVALMGGRVWVESEIGKGSTFFFSVDMQMPKTPHIEDQPVIQAELGGVPILIVIEHAATRTVVAEVLRAKGAEVMETASETEALAALRLAHLRELRPKLLLVDAEMKSSDGYEAVGRFRAAEPDAAVVMLTNSNGLPAKLRQMRERGIRCYTTKPIKRQELYGVVAEALLKAASARMVPTAPIEALVSIAAPAIVADRQLTILLADDSPDNRMLIRAYLKRSPYLLTEVENGEVAVERFINGGYDLVLMDVQMPVLDGHSAVRAIRKWELEQRRPRTPIIALTASALDGDVQRAEQAGCDMHVSKPVKKSTLLEAIAHAIEALGNGAAIGKSDLDGNNPTPVVAANAASVHSVAFNPDFQI
jgi:PAS domain S-box-containing protein